MKTLSFYNAYAIQLQDLKKYFGCTSSDLKKQILDICPQDTKLGLDTILKGEQPCSTITGKQYFSALIFLCNLEGEKIDIPEFNNASEILQDIVSLVMMPVKMVHNPQFTSGMSLYYADPKNLLSILNIDISESRTVSNEEMALALITFIGNHIESSQLVSNVSELLSNPNYTNTVFGLVSLFLFALKKRKNIILFLK